MTRVLSPLEALIADLYSQIIALQQEVEELRRPSAPPSPERK